MEFCKCRIVCFSQKLLTRLNKLFLFGRFSTIVTKNGKWIHTLSYKTRHVAKTVESHAILMRKLSFVAKKPNLMSLTESGLAERD